MKFTTYELSLSKSLT